MTFGQLKIDRDATPGTTTLLVSGEVDLATVDTLVEAVEGAVPDGGTLVLDLVGVEFMDSAGVAAVNRCRRLAVAADARMVVRCRDGGPVAQLVAWTGLDTVVDVEIVDGPTVA
ncbi:MAG: Anti-sigma factor antagonist [Solirubrobacterales bacterium]|jgi:anti-anti-sigma factor|nr:Anti-sigma factor antagonist [Solirubrobacterales bacterium]